MWSAAILTGGQATRFGGSDKSALVVDGETNRARQLAALAQIADDIIIVGPVARRLQPSDLNVPAEMRVSGDPETLAANVDTPDEYRRTGAHQGHKP